MLVTVTLVAGQNQGVSTPIGVLNPGDLPISQVVRPSRIEQMAADLRNLESLGLITFSVADDPATDDRFQVMTRNAQSAASSEFQGEDITFYVPLPTTGSSSAADVVVIAPGTFRGKQLRILDCFVSVTTLQAASQCQLFDTAGGSGALSAAMLTSATGTIRHASTAALGLMTKAKGLYANRTKGNAVGELVIWCRAEY